MIIGSLTQTKRFEILHPDFKKVFEYVRSGDWQQVTAGKIILEEDKIWVNVDEVTGKSREAAKLEAHNRFFVNEIIREKILQYYDKEVPYSVEVEVEEFKEDDKRINIMAVIYVERSSQKGIIIGSQGEALKKVGTQARLDIEAFFGKKVFLNLYVKVLKDWRNKDSELKNFGYANK